MLLKRILAAVVGIPIIFTCIYFGEIPFFALMLVVSFFCVWEYLKLTKKYNPHFVVSLVLSVLFFMFLYVSPFADKVSASAIAMLLILFGIEVFGKNTKSCVSRISVSFLGAFFLPLALYHMLRIRAFDGGMQFIFMLFITVWILDTAAYAFGKMLGKHKLSAVSPKKTIEGAVAGVIFGVATAIACRYVFMSEFLTVQQAAIIGFVIAIVGQFSDIAESLIKRDAKIKDSGNTIPGHGGFLDRFDSYIFAAPAVFYILQLFK